MNVEAYDADMLRKVVRVLERENQLLKDKLKNAGIPYEEVNLFEEKLENAELSPVREFSGRQDLPQKARGEDAS